MMAGNLAGAKAKTLGDKLGDVKAEALLLKRFRPRHLVTHWLICRPNTHLNAA